MSDGEIAEFSCGIIPVERVGDEWHLLLVRLHAGHWGFPKGHREEGESSLETATRELAEETGLEIVRLFSEEPIVEEYWLRRSFDRVRKQVVYFVAEVRGELKIQEEEVREAKWVPIDAVTRYVRFSSIRQLIAEVRTRLE